jgi:hypothetical protein
MYKLIGLLLIVLSISISCKQEKLLEEYYMPPMGEDETKVLVYESTNILKNMQFWVVEKKNSRYLIEVYDRTGNLLQQSVEEITSKGILQKDVKIRWRDSTGQREIFVEPSILQGGLFPFEPRDSSHAYVHCIHWVVADKEFELCRNRRYLGEKSLTLEGEELNCAVFLTSEMYGDELEGYLQVRTDGVEYYIRDRGLVLKKKFVTGLMDVGQKQINILDLESFRQSYPEIASKI